MSQSGARQICRSGQFPEAYTVKLCDDDLLQRVSVKYPQMKAFIDRAKSAGKVDYMIRVQPWSTARSKQISVCFCAYMC